MRLARKQGWSVYIHDQVIGQDGHHKCGAITLARWPVEVLEAPGALPSGRGGML